LRVSWTQCVTIQPGLLFDTQVGRVWCAERGIQGAGEGACGGVGQCVTVLEWGCCLTRRWVGWCVVWALCCVC
jgi:hypothetical protein